MELDKKIGIQEVCLLCESAQLMTETFTSCMEEEAK